MFQRFILGLGNPWIVLIIGLALAGLNTANLFCMCAEWRRQWSAAESALWYLMIFGPYLLASMGGWLELPNSKTPIRIGSICVILLGVPAGVIPINDLLLKLQGEVSFSGALHTTRVIAVVQYSAAL